MFGKIGRGLHNAGAGLHAMSKAQAQWEIELGRTILLRRKKLLLLVLSPIIIALIWSWATATPADSAPAALSAATTAAAADPAGSAESLPSKIPILGGSKAYMPAIVNPTRFWGSIFVGLIAGLITGVIGAGGGYILTPALMSFGVRGIMAVGTDQFHLFAKAIMGTTIHRKLGNVNWLLAVWFVVGSVVGVTLGGTLSRAIFRYSPALSDAVISSVYVVVLGTLGMYAIVDWLRLRKGVAGATEVQATTFFAKWLQALPLKPRVKFDEGMVEGGRSISVYPVILCGLIVGFVAAIMGVGGGFLTFPMFVYGLGVSTFTTVGTDIFQIIFTAGYSSLSEYARYGFVFYTVAVGMLVGSLVGVQIGAMITNVVKGSQIRAFFALTILAGFFNRLFALPRKLADLGFMSLSRDAAVGLETAGVYLFFGTVSIFALWILWVFFSKLRLMRNDKNGAPVLPGGPIIVHPGRLVIGVTMIVVFALVLSYGTTASDDGKTALSRADNFFNQLAKDSANFIDDPKFRKEIDSMAAEPVDIGISPREHANKDRMRSILSSCECSLTESEDGRLRIKCSMGQLCKTALDDAKHAFANDDAYFKEKHQLRPHEAVYCWWIVFDGLSRRYVQENKAELAELTRAVAQKVMEPAYNFRDIEARNIRENVRPAAGLLGFYILYTLWYGFAILFVMEGFGIAMTVAKHRKET